VAGLTLAAYAIPVSVAYASLAGLPPQAGLYCYLLGGIAYAVFGSSRHLAIGPTSAISILIGSVLATLAAGDPSRQMHLAAAVGVIAGAIGLIASLLRLGSVSNFVSETVLSGFKVGVGLVIASTQLPKLFGINAGGNDFFSRIIAISRNLTGTDIATLGVGLGGLLLLVLGERLFPGRPVALFVVVLSVGVMSYFPHALGSVKTVGMIPEGLPQLAWPLVRWTEVNDLLALGLACFLLSYVESISVARTFAVKHEYAIDPGTELRALAIANFAAGVGQGYPLAGGMSQSAVNEKGGAQTPMSLVVASGAIGVVLLFVAGLLRNLPQPILAAVVLTAVAGLVQIRDIRQLYRVSKMEFYLAIVAMICVLAFGVLKGVLLAAIVSILLLLRRASYPRIVMLGRLPGSDRFADLSRYPESKPVAHVLILRIEAGLFYFNTQNVQNEILSHVNRQSGIQLLIIDLSTSANIDLAGVRMLGQLNRQVSQTGVVLSLAEVHGEVRGFLQADGLAAQIPGVAHRMGIEALLTALENSTEHLAAQNEEVRTHSG
jgi:high affinity sulfate transporter 1